MTPSRFNAQPGTLIDASTLRMQRRLPGPIERVWSYLSDGELRRQWLAAGTMPLHDGASFELVWRNGELSDPDDPRPDGFAPESRATCRFVEVDPPRAMRFEWPGVGEVSFELEPAGDEVMLTLTHRQLAGEALVLSVCAGWHAHLAALVARLEGRRPPSFWRTWTGLRESYREQIGVC